MNFTRTIDLLPNSRHSKEGSWAHLLERHTQRALQGIWLSKVNLATSREWHVHIEHLRGDV
jgi:hypothetical protein